MNKRLKKTLLLLCFVPLGTHCGTGIQTNSDPNGTGTGRGTRTTVATFSDPFLRLNLFSLGSDFPADIVIPDIQGMRSTAFIATDNPILGVLPVDLDRLEFSDDFAGLDASGAALAGLLQYARRILILSPTRAILLGGGGMVLFNPGNGQVLQSMPLDEEIQLSAPLQLSRPADVDNDGQKETSVSGAFTPTFADSLAVVGNRLFVAMDNLFFDGPAGTPGYFAQGILRVFEFSDSPPFIQSAATPYVKLDAFNPTSMTVFQGGLIVTMTGATELFEGGQVPLTASKLIKLNPSTLGLTATLNLGLVAAGDRPLAITPDGSRAFLGSAAFSEVYEINLPQFSVVRGENNPIVLSNLASDFITGQQVAHGGEVLLVSSFNRSVVQGIDLTDPQRKVLNEELDFSIDPNPGITGAGPMALRPGIPGVDFGGADLWVLTGSPGTLSSALTY